LLKLGGFNEELTNGQEHDLLLRFAITGSKFAYVPKALSCNRTKHNPRSITTMAQQYPNRLEELFCHFEAMLKKTELWLPQVRAALGWRFHMVGIDYLHLGNSRRAVAMFEKASQIEPKYVAELPLSRRLVIPMLGGYIAEKFFRKFHRVKTGLLNFSM
jgi:hypothetical protein